MSTPRNLKPTLRRTPTPTPSRMGYRTRISIDEDVNHQIKHSLVEMAIPIWLRLQKLKGKFIK